MIVKVDGPDVAPGPMRVVVAYDMSIDADRALAVVGDGEWPPGSVVRVVTSPNGLGNLSSFAGPHESLEHERRVRSAIASGHERAAERLAASGIRFEAAIVDGPAGAAIVRDAEASGADLIVAGARALSSIEATLLGSVSTEITAKARCPALIVRVESIERVVLATDGSEAADAATDLVARWPLFARSEIRVLGVASQRPHAAGAVLSEDQLARAWRDDLDDARARALTPVERSVQELVARGRQANGDVRIGRAADEIAAAAREWPADLVVVGTTGKSLVRRLVLGSVARSVLSGVQSSVLIVGPRSRQVAAIEQVSIAG